MTAAAQRIWEAIYAAEFVRRATIARSNDNLIDGGDINRLSEGAADLAEWHAECAKQVYEPSRFRRRSR